MRLLLFIVLLAVPGLCYARPNGTWIHSRTIRDAAPFHAVGVFWREPAISSVRVRASTDGRNWTAWAVARGERVDAARTGTGLIYFGEGFRFLAVEGVSDPEVLLIDPGPSPASGGRGKRIESSAAPQVVTRAEWGCTPQTCPVKDAPIYTTVTHLIVHHTDGANAAADWPAVVRSIWVLHVQGNGWNDIGYNYLIDPNGVLYEGRAGGDGVVGAHFSGVNSGTMGVALLGTYVDQTPPERMRATLADMLAWQAEKWSLDPAGESLHASSGLLLNVVSGHRDAGLSPKATSTTECPGNTAYTLLPALRDAVALRMTTCIRVVGERNQCLPFGGDDRLVPVLIRQPGCEAHVSAPDWITAEITGSAMRLRAAPNSGERRSAVVSVNGQNVTIAQASAAEQSLSCIAQRGTVNAADFDQRPVAAGSLLTVFGDNFTPDTTLALNGKPVPAQYAAANQMNLLLPAATAIGTNYFTTTTSGVTGPPTGFWVTEAMPAIFADAQRHAIAINADDSSLNTPSHPARAGSALTVYVTGGGAVDNTALHNARSSWSATVGGNAAGALFLGLAPSIAGVYQANIVVPAGLAAGDYPLLVTVNGVAAREAVISVGP